MAPTEGPWGVKAVPHLVLLNHFLPSSPQPTLFCFVFFLTQEETQTPENKESPAPARYPVPAAVSEGDQLFLGMEASPPGALSAPKKLRSWPSLSEGCLCEVEITQIPIPARLPWPLTCGHFPRAGSGKAASAPSRPPGGYFSLLMNHLDSQSLCFSI